jgi:hypothetical protein
MSRRWLVVAVILAAVAMTTHTNPAVAENPKVPSPVNVMNAPSVKQEGPWTVGVSGTPTVTISSSANAPVFVREPARKPLIRDLGFTPFSPSQSSDYTAQLTYTVPDGQEAVITQVSCRCNVAAGTTMEFWFRTISTEGPAVFAESRLPNPDRSGLSLPPGREHVAVAQRTELYLGPGDILSVYAMADTGDGSLDCYINGYLVKAE